VLLAGCGSAVSKQDVIARGDAICDNALRAVRTVPPPAGSTGAAAYFGRIAPIVVTEATQLRKLPRPPADRALLDSYIASAARVAGDYLALAAAARSGNRDALATAGAALRESDAPALAGRYGLRDCATSAGTSPGS
jgi:hypothetical protein